MSLDGRIEKRIPMGIPVYLVGLKKPRTAERVLTENVSPHGARVVTKRRSQPGEDQWITPLSGQFQLPAQVIYCQPLANGDYCVGLDFRGRPVNWEDELISAA
jgi:PilZ domain